MVGTRRNGGSGTGTTGQTVVSGEVKCGLCNSGNPVLLNGIGCNQCPKWFHPVTMCTGLKPQTIKVIQRDGGDGVRFVCNDCRCTPSNRTPPQNAAGPGINVNASQVAGASDSSDAGSVSQLYEMVRSIAQSVAALTTQVAVLISKISSAPALSQTNGSCNFHRESLYAEMREFNERSKRRDSLIIRGSGAESDARLRAVLNEVGGVIMGNSIEPDSVHCINRVNSLYRVEIKCSDIRNRLLADSRKLKDTNFSHIFISHDLTYLQRQERRDNRAASQHAQFSDGIDHDAVHVTDSNQRGRGAILRGRGFHRGGRGSNQRGRGVSFIGRGQEIEPTNDQTMVNRGPLASRPVSSVDVSQGPSTSGGQAGGSMGSGSNAVPIAVSRIVSQNF